MRRALAAFVLVLASTASAAEKTYEATYTATLANIAPGTKQLKVWLPLPASRRLQTVSDIVIDSPYRWERRTDPTYGNQYAFATIANPPAGDLKVDVRFRVTRKEARFDSPAERVASKHELQLALAPNKLVTISPRLRKLADEVTAGKKGTIEQARAIYDHLLATMKYDKTIVGWGQGDSERACDVRAGNCTDFHSLFMSLARAKGIPTRFVIGFPLTAADGVVKGYHCWAEFYVDGKGWIPVDASDASKSADPAVRQYLFGNLDPKRVEFTVGRDLELKPATLQPLNYFIYPRAEAAGLVVGEPSIALSFKEIGSE